ncbi:MAG: sigma-70 family RNA polymerase sigma factor, partial [Oscillospiraceae bacterium]|nr:sigma-70 family RNA polymerase sigma factor [Oscillospiraceae bacterium]
DLLKKQKREQLTLDEDNENSAANEIADTTSTEDTVTGKLAVAEALESLDESEREIVNMKILADMTFKDIAAVLGKPLGTVTWKYRNAISKLRKYVGEVQSV